MKKYLYLLFAILIFPTYVQADDNIKNITQDIYKNCDSHIQQISETDTIKGNIKDVERERELRQCLKNKLFEIAQNTLLSEEVEKFKQTINNLEQNYKQYYTLLIFCSKDSSERWCSERAYDDMSLESLQREKSITSQLVKQISELLETQQNNQ